MIGGIAIIASLGCSPRVHEPTRREPAQGMAADQQPLHNQIDVKRRQQLVARAEQSLAESMPLDYRRPFTSYSPDRPVTASLYLEACRAGDNPSCWIATNLSATQWLGEATSLVLANCRAGDMMSCRAAPPDMGDPRVPGWAGRSDICVTFLFDPIAEQNNCGIDVLRRECLEGFPLSCSVFERAPPEKPLDRQALVARIIPLAREGCRVRIDEECRLLRADTATDVVVVADRMCSLGVYWCDVLSKHYRGKGEVARARDLAEKTCQYGANLSRSYCRELGKDYANGVFQEPVPGRGEALLTWTCDSEIAKERDPVCKARAAKQHDRTPKAR